MSSSDIAAAAVAKERSLLQGGALTTIVLGAFGGVFGVFLTPTLLAYFLASGRQLVRGLPRIFPPDWRPLTARIIDALRPILLRYFAGIAASSSTPAAPPTSGSASFFTFNMRRSSRR